MKDGTQRFVVGLTMPNLNDFIDARGKSPYAYARMKKKWGEVVALYAQKDRLERLEGPTHFSFHFMERDRRRDPDGVAAGAMKVILDSLQLLRILPGDGWKWISGIDFTWEVSKTPGVVVTMRTG